MIMNNKITLTIDTVLIQKCNNTILVVSNVTSVRAYKNIGWCYVTGVCWIFIYANPIRPIS